MSFLDTNISEFISSRITQKGRNAIAKGKFDITYYVIGDSEYDYSNPFSGMTGTPNTVPNQNIFAPLDKDTNVKYPIKYNESGTIYGTPISFNQNVIIRNSIGPAGFVSEYKQTGTTISSGSTNTFNVAGINGGTTLQVSKPTGMTYDNCQYITLTLNSLSGASNNRISSNINSFVYKIMGVSGATSGTTQIITVDRTLPVLSFLPVGISGNVICNKCEVEYPPSDIDNVCLPFPPNNNDQHNPWTLNIIYGKKPIGLSGETGNSDLRSLSGYTSNKYIGVKEYLGYNSTGQTFLNSTGGTITVPTSYKNSYNEEIEIVSTKQRSIAIVHFSEIGDIVNDPDRFFRYDDYISHTGNSTNFVAKDSVGNDISDKDYFQVYIPFLLYHRNTGTTYGAVFSMGSEDKYLISKITNSTITKYRDLNDEKGNKVGKVFVNKKIVVFDDPEIVACLDYKSNRKHTLPAPKVFVTPTTGTTSLLSTETTKLYLTYYFNITGQTRLNSVPCSYISETTGTTNGSDVSFSFGNEFNYMVASLGDYYKGFTGNEFFILAQTGTTSGSLNNSNWKKINFTNEVTVPSVITPSSLTGKTFTLTHQKYTGGTSFDLTSHYSGHNMTFTGNTGPYFGDEQPFPGSIKVVRASDIEEMNFMINLPPNTFSKSQNPTFVSGNNPKITEIALLNSNKETMVMAKTSKPITRSGTQVFSIKLDF
jgi:hypothetical protein